MSEARRLIGRGPGAEAAARRIIVPALAAALLGLAGFIVGLTLDPERALLSYLAAFAFALSMVLGTLFMVMIAHVTNAKWFVVVRRLAESITATLPVFLLLVLPILIGISTLYPWVPPLEGFARPELEAIRHKQAYLNVPFFVGRSVFYLLVWAGLARALRSWSLRQDHDPEAAPAVRAVRISGPGIAAAGLAMSFAAVDWIMSLSPTWVSSIFGVYWFAGGMYGGLAILTLVTELARRAGTLDRELAEGHFYALGRLMLTFTIFWAYIAFSQGFLIYIGDLPREIGWYTARGSGAWYALLMVLIVGHFFLPFFALLSYRLKHDGPKLALVAGWMVLMHYVDIFWLVVPGIHGSSPVARWYDPFTLLLVLGTAAAFGAWRVAGDAAMPERDPRLATSIDYRRE